LGGTTRATLIGEDPLSGLAVLEISGPVASSATSANLGSIASVHEADAVLAVGSRTTSLSPGLVSSEDRTVALSDGTDIDGLLAVSMPSLAVSAMGGPLLDQFGQVIGLTVGVEPVNEADTHLTFAIPIDEVSRIGSEFINGGRATHPWLGVTDAEDVPSDIARHLQLLGGVEAVSVATQGPAGLAGLRSNDVVTAFDGKTVTSAGALMAQVNSCIPGRSVPMTYVQDGRPVSTLVKVGDEPQDS
jgi:putative serine protease PepD